MFFALFLLQFGVALTASALAAWAFSRATGAVLTRAFGDEAQRGWRWLVRFAVVVLGVSGGVRLAVLDGYAEAGTPALSAEAWTLEAFRAALGALESVVWALLLFFLIALFAASLRGRREASQSLT